jgi:hypothetical protein
LHPAVLWRLHVVARFIESIVHSPPTTPGAMNRAPTKPNAQNQESKGKHIEGAFWCTTDDARQKQRHPHL